MEDDKKEGLARKYQINIDSIGERRKNRSYTYWGYFYGEALKSDINKEYYGRWARQKFLENLKHTALIGLTTASMILLTMDMYKKDPVAHENLRPIVEYAESIGNNLKSKIQHMLKAVDNHVEM